MNISIMQQALGEAWDRLDDSVKAHYKLVPGTKQKLSYKAPWTRFTILSGRNRSFGLAGYSEPWFLIKARRSL